MTNEDLTTEILRLRASLTAVSAEKANFAGALKSVGIADDHGTLRWIFKPGEIEVSSSGGEADQRLAGLLNQARYVIDDQARKLAEVSRRLAQVQKYAQHLRTCPWFMAMRFQLEPEWIVESHIKPCTCGFNELALSAPTTEGS